MLNQYGLDTLRRLTSYYEWEIMTRLAERPATIDQLVKQTGFSRNKVLESTRSLAALGLIRRPRRQKGITGLIVAEQPELLKAFIRAVEDYYYTIADKRLEAAEREAERWREFMETKPTRLSERPDLKLVHSA